MQRIIVQVPMTKELKEKAEDVSSDLGFSSLQEAIRVLLTKLSKKEFSLKVEEAEENPSKYLLNAMKKARENRKTGKVSPVFTNVEDEIDWLEKQGI